MHLGVQSIKAARWWLFDEPEELEYFTILPDTQFGNIRFLEYAYLAFLDSSRLCNVEEHNFPNVISNDKNNFLCVLV